MTAFVMTLLIATLAPHGSTALLERAQKAVRAGNAGEALPLYELVLERSASVDRATFGRTQGAYWQVVQSEQEWPRAYHFFAHLAPDHQGSADVLGAYASSIGGYLGWLHAANVLEMPEDMALVRALDQKARQAYARALELDKENFGALLGLAIYESHAPGGAQRSREAFARLNALRKTHPEYPWKMVDQVASERAVR